MSASSCNVVAVLVSRVDSRHLPSIVIFTFGGARRCTVAEPVNKVDVDTLYSFYIPAFLLDDIQQRCSPHKDTHKRAFSELLQKGTE